MLPVGLGEDIKVEIHVKVPIETEIKIKIPWWRRNWSPNGVEIDDNRRSRRGRG